MMKQENNTIEIFVEKHNGFLKDGKPDDEYWEAKEGRFQFRITTVHYISEEKARERLQEILTTLKEYPKLKEEFNDLNELCATRQVQIDNITERAEQNLNVAMANWKNEQEENYKLKTENEELARSSNWFKKLYDEVSQENDKLKKDLNYMHELNNGLNYSYDEIKKQLDKEKEEHRIWYEQVDKLSDVLFMIKFEMEGFERQGKKQEFFNQFYKAISELVKNERLSVSTYQKLQHENKELSQQLECYKEHDSTLEKLISTHTLISLTDLEKHDKLVKGLEHIVAGMAYAEARKEFHTIGYWRTQILSLFTEVIKP